MRTHPKNRAARHLGLALMAALMVTPAQAVQPDEILDDPVLETRARDLSKGLRCLVCQNQSIDDSDATLARDLRLVVRERLVAGDSNDQVIDYVVSRYGEYVLLKPRFTLGNAALYLGGPFLLLVGGFAFWRLTRQSAHSVASAGGPAPLSEEERKKLNALMDREG